MTDRVWLGRLDLNQKIIQKESSCLPNSITSFYLDEEQRSQLEQVARSYKRTPRQRTRARILLLADAADTGGYKDELICQQVGTSASTVVRVRQRFAQGGLEAALGHKPQEKRKARKLDEAWT